MTSAGFDAIPGPSTAPVVTQEGAIGKHTAGAWGVEDPMDHCLAIIANPDAPTYEWVWVASCDWPDEDAHDITSSEVKANARLIAAAPELLAALKALLEDSYPVGACENVEVRELAIAAIAKATRA